MGARETRETELVEKHHRPRNFKLGHIKGLVPEPKTKHPSPNSLTYNHSRSSGRSSIRCPDPTALQPLPQGFSYSKRDSRNDFQLSRVHENPGPVKHTKGTLVRGSLLSAPAVWTLSTETATAGQTRGGGEKECAQEHKHKPVGSLTSQASASS